MTTLDFLCLTPFIIVASAPVVMMLTLPVARNLKVIYGFSLFMFSAAFLSLFFIASHLPHQLEPLIIIDSYGLLFLGMILFTGILLTLLSYIYLHQHGGEREEYFIILFVATLGACILVVANHFITFFLGLETLSISLYVMIAYLKYRDYSIEAGVKFLVIASVATAFLLFGMALIYAVTGTMSFTGIALQLTSIGLTPLVLTGLGMMLAGIGFKLALVPFHMWAPDVYQGAPAPVTAFIATVSKGAVMAIALRFFISIKGYEKSNLILVITVTAVLSMFTGNLLALRQTNFKRLLAYSSIAHMGYLMITLLTGTANGIQAALFYLISYTITSLGAFGIISVLSLCDRDTGEIKDLEGLFRKNPWLAMVLTLVLFSLAGIPLTAGFIAKFYLVLEGVRSGLWILAFSLIINTVISLYYYLRVIKTMFTVSETGSYAPLPIAAHFVLAAVTIGILFLGILPAFITDIIKSLLAIN
jgi:NADH-quinone oxidoreductase subunit N